MSTRRPGRRRPPVWLVVAVVIAVIVFVPPLRHTLGVFLAHAAAVIVGAATTVFVLLPKPASRR